MKSQYGYLHIYPQYSHHGEARIVGDELGLQTLCAAIAHALKYGEKESDALFASDGEGYSVEVEKVASIDDLEPYYSAYQKNEEAATWRERAFKAEAELSKLRSAAAIKAERDAALARVAELEKDTARLEFVCNSPNRMVERENGLWRVYEDVAPTDHPTAVWQGMTTRWHVSPREAIDAAITAALTKGQP